MAQRDDDRNDRRSAPTRRSDGRVPPHNLHAEESLRLKRRMHNLYAKHCGRTYEEVEKALERDNFMTPEQARDWGLVDHVYHDRSQIEGVAPA